MSACNGVDKIRIIISGNTFQEQHYFKNGKPKPKISPDVHLSSRFVVDISTSLSKFMKETAMSIFGVPLNEKDYLFSLQTEGQLQEIFDQEEINEKTISELGITHNQELKMTIVHKDVNKWRPPPRPAERNKSIRVTDEQRLRQTEAVLYDEKARRQEKRKEKRKREERRDRRAARAALTDPTNPMAIEAASLTDPTNPMAIEAASTNPTNPMAIQAASTNPTNPMAIQAASTNPILLGNGDSAPETRSEQIVIPGGGFRLSDGKKVPGDIASKKKAAPQTTANNLLATDDSAQKSLVDLFKGELSIRKKDEKVMMRVLSVENCSFEFENCPNEGVTGGGDEILGYKQVIFLKGIEANDKHMDQVIIYKIHVVKNALRAAIQMLTFAGRGIKINPTLIAERSPALFWSLVFEYKDKKISVEKMLSEGLPNYDWKHLAESRVRKQSAKAIENQRQETEEAAITLAPAMVVHNSLFRRAMSLICKTECSVGEAEMAVEQAQSLLSIQHDGDLNKPVSQTLLGRTLLFLYIKKQLAKPDPPFAMQLLLDGTRDSIYPDLSGAECSFDEKDRTSQDNSNGKGQFKSDDNDYKDKDDGSEEDERGDDDDDDDEDEDDFDSGILSEADIFVTQAHETLREEEDKMKTEMKHIPDMGRKLSTADVNRLKFLRQELVAVYILSGINYSIINDTRGASACFKCAMLYTEEELKKMKVKDSITMDMERLNIQRLSVTAGALLTRELMKPAENKGIIILGGSEDNNVIDMEQGDDMDENYHRDFIIDHFSMTQSMLKSVICDAKKMSDKGDIHGKAEFVKSSRLASGMNILAKNLGCL